MFEIDKQWISRLHHALYLAESFCNEELVWELKSLEIKFFSSELQDFEWSRLSEIEDQIENNR